MRRRSQTICYVFSLNLVLVTNDKRVNLNIYIMRTNANIPTNNLGEESGKKYLAIPFSTIQHIIINNIIASVFFDQVLHVLQFLHLYFLFSFVNINHSNGTGALHFLQVGLNFIF